MIDIIRPTLNEQECHHLVQLVIRAATDAAPDPGTAADALIVALAALLASLSLSMGDVDSLAEKAGRKIRSLVRELRTRNTQ
jgi:thiamine pyrophosphokinase